MPKHFHYESNPEIKQTLRSQRSLVTDTLPPKSLKYSQSYQAETLRNLCSVLNIMIMKQYLNPMIGSVRLAM